MSRTERALPVAVIGAGFSGTMAALQLLATLGRERPVLLCERGGAFARGLAYGTDNPDHLLNLRAANMSAFPDRPAHFEEWLARSAFDAEERSGIRATPAGTFAARGLYGRYLTELLTRTLAAKGGAHRLILMPDAVTDLVGEPGGGFRLQTEAGRSYEVAGAVLAMGNLGGHGGPSSRFRVDPWSPDGFGRLRADRPVLIVGTGLTMVDAVAALRRHGFAGPIVALSRRGLLPKAHAPTTSRPPPALGEETRASLPRLLKAIRGEITAAKAAGADWRGVIDALRPITDMLWRGLPPAEQARFLRHLRPFWDVHRHRTAPPAAEAIADEIAAGSLSIVAGRILSVADGESDATITFRRRGQRRTTTIAAQRILDATGFGRIAETDDPLLRRLLDRGLARPGPHGFGLDAGPDYGLLAPHAGGRLWTLGPLLRGVLWECMAVPDIRNEAVDLAQRVAAVLERRDVS